MAHPHTHTRSVKVLFLISKKQNLDYCDKTGNYSVITLSSNDSVTSLKYFASEKCLIIYKVSEV